MLPKPLVIIHGPMGVGKTSVCRYVLERLDRAAWLDGDWCWTMHPWSFSERNRAMVLSNVAHILTGFLENPEFDIVLFSWVIHMPEIFDTLLSALPVCCKLETGGNAKGNPQKCKGEIPGIASGH